MLWFEREVVRALVSDADLGVRSGVEAFVDGTLRDMPEFLRAAVAAESIVFGGYGAVRKVRGRLDRGQMLDLLDAWERSPVGPIRQYVRLLRGLVLFAEQEMAVERTEAPEKVA